MSNGMQSVDWHKYINLILYTRPHFLNEFFRKLCQAAYWEWHGRFALVNLANMNLLHNYHGEGAWSLCVCTTNVIGMAPSE